MKYQAYLRRTGIAAGAVAVLVAGILVPIPAQARVIVGFGFGVPVVPAPWYYAPPPVVYAPPPVVYAPPPMVVAPPPQPTYLSQPAPNWYYCDDPKGYYPYVPSCKRAWRPVPAQPAPAPPK